MDDGHEFWPAIFKRIDDLSFLDDVPPGRLHLCDFGATALRHVDHAPSEHAVDTDNDLVTGFDQIDEAKFHPCAARAADRKGHFILGLKYFAQHHFDLIHHFHENWIEMTDQRGGHRLQDGGRDIARPRPHQQALWWLKRFMHSEALYEKRAREESALNGYKDRNRWCLIE